MPACARKEIVRKGRPGIYHCWQQCVRRAWLLGTDPLTGVDHNHRRDWFIERLQLLVRCFMIDVGFHAILSNHFHLVLRTSPRLAKQLSSREVARRWLSVFPGTRVLDGNWIEPTEEQIEKLAQDKQRIRKLRRRLASVSWFMSALSEYIARRANREDDTKGRFFSGRFACRECTSEAALLICGMYVDLNQIRAGEAISPETSRHCSVWWRIQAEFEGETAMQGQPIDAWLARLTLREADLSDVPSTTGHRSSDKGLLPLSLKNYVRLLDYAGRQKYSGKRGVIPADLAPVLERLGLKEQDLADTIDNFPSLFRRLAGSAQQMIDRAKEVGRKWFHGVRAARKLFSEPPESG